ncbi:2TM domain-containing protein [Rhodocytophaga rosea]|uniref:2TM domain-containing protein n=1 Tax=Rhodocytophaga rosea TaxID=2704465 RepID=A0A6C0GJ55_9BACT|nr:2TM domain-containing protein [Rhodocytophaga rosea]QHT67713.1 2TM domain-containing protein [Rhodocytophaga rosea]
MNETPETYKRAHRHVKKRLNFYRNLIAFVIINTALIVINLLTSPDHLWFYWPLLGWGIGLAFQAFSTFSSFSPIAGEWEERKIKEYMEKNQ